MQIPIEKEAHPIFKAFCIVVGGILLIAIFAFEYHLISSLLPPIPCR